MMFEPLAGQRQVRVTKRRTAVDYAHAVRELVDIHYADAAQIVLVQDNLNTHKPASLYEAFPVDSPRVGCREHGEQEQTGAFPAYCLRGWLSACGPRQPPPGGAGFRATARLP